MLRKIWILRLGHRVPRDQRVSTHLALTARALGASKLFYSGVRDPEFEKKILSISSNWGGDFELKFVDNPINLIEHVRKDGFKIVHLTMYGIPLNYLLDELLKNEKFLIIVGGEKVPKEYFYISDYNIAIGLQPHSEISALAIFLDRIFQGAFIDNVFVGGQFKIIPAKKGKYSINVERVNSDISDLLENQT